MGKGFMILNRLDVDYISSVLIYLKNVELMKFGESLEEAHNSCWMPFEKDLFWFWSADNKQRVLYGIFKFHDNRILLCREESPSRFARWKI